MKPPPLVRRVESEQKEREEREAKLAANWLIIKELEQKAIARRLAANEESRVPASGTILSTQQRTELMVGDVLFQPGPIPPTGAVVDAPTPLHSGQDVLLSWNETWWAATIIGFDSDGSVRVTYFGWDRSYDEIVPHSDLQLDGNARSRAIDATYPVRR